LKTILSDDQVHVAAVKTAPPPYLDEPPYHPAEAYPEYPFGSALSGRPNPGYAAVREALATLGLDAAHFGTEKWNPLGAIIRPGDTVLIKPNMVRHFHDEGGGTDELITHGSIIRAVADYAFIALKGEGRLIIADSPQNDAVFAELERLLGLPEIKAFYGQVAPGVGLEYFDLRVEACIKKQGVIVDHLKLAGDPMGYVVVDLGSRSEFAEIPWAVGRLRGAEYDIDDTTRHHNEKKHEYLIPKTILSADVIISVPKLKTHKKSGITVNLKNMIGICGDKNWLPHHREGVPSEGGDQYAESGAKQRLEQRLIDAFKRRMAHAGPLVRWMGAGLRAAGRWVFGDTNRGTGRSGNWNGNDTIWRTCLDLNKILIYADADGNLGQEPARRYFSFVDGLIAGEGNGPLAPTAKAAQILLAGFNPALVDAAAARLMGFDPRKIPIIARALRTEGYALTTASVGDVRIHSNVPELDRSLSEIRGACLAFEPPFGWKGHGEWTSGSGDDE